MFAVNHVSQIDKVYDMVTHDESQRNAKKGVPVKSSAMYTRSGVMKSKITQGALFLIAKCLYIRRRHAIKSLDTHQAGKAET